MINFSLSVCCEENDERRIPFSTILDEEKASCTPRPPASVPAPSPCPRNRRRPYTNASHDTSPSRAIPSRTERAIDAARNGCVVCPTTSVGVAETKGELGMVGLAATVGESCADAEGWTTGDALPSNASIPASLPIPKWRFAILRFRMARRCRAGFE